MTAMEYAKALALPEQTIEALKQIKHVDLYGSFARARNRVQIRC